MNDRQNRRHQMFIRVREFLATRINDFSANGAVRQLYTQLIEVITTLNTYAAQQASGIGQARQRTETRGDARLTLREALQAINRAARTMGLENQFPVPPFSNDRNLLSAARAVARDAVPLQAQFILHELTEDFLEELNANILRFENEIAGQQSAVDDHVNASASIDDTVDDGVEIVHKLDGPIRNKYTDDPGTLAEWETASHTERAPRRRSTNAPPLSSDGSTPPSQPTA